MGKPMLLERRRAEPADASPIRVMLVDDSIVARAIFARILSGHPAFSVVAQAGSADQALEALTHQPVDIVLLDLEMPGTSGLDALPAILAASHGARVLIVSAACAEGAHATLRALMLGAADTLLKPTPGARTGEFAEQLCDRLLRIASAPRSLAAPLRPKPDGFPPTDTIDCVAIGASTGGLHAMAALFAGWPAHSRAPILITQHLPQVFMPFFAAQIEQMARRPAHVAADNMRLDDGHIYVAPGNGHISLAKTVAQPRIVIDRARSASGCMPSVDPMLLAVAQIYGPRALAIMLSGMGRDGAFGASRLVDAGGTLFAQDLESSVVWGMPGAVAPLAAVVAPPAGLAEAVARRTRIRSDAAWK